MNEVPQRISPRSLRLTLLCLLGFVVLFTGVPHSPFATVSPSEVVGAWNRYLGQSNVLECWNESDDEIVAELTVRHRAGEVLARSYFSTQPHGTTHRILDPSAPAASYGTFAVRILDGELALRCSTVFYGWDEGILRFSYSLPLLRPFVGPTRGLFNSFDASGAAVPVENWLSVYNPSSTSFSAQVLLYNLAGAFERSFPIVALPGFSRIDLGLGHPFGYQAGLYVIQPADPEQPYGAYLARFVKRAGRPVAGYSFVPLTGSGRHSMVGTSTMGNAQNWLEIGNTSNAPIKVAVKLKSQRGALLRGTTIDLAPHAQRHLFVNPSLGSDAIGMAELDCISSTCAPDSTLFQSVFYGLGADGVSWAYGTQGLPESNFATEPLTLPVNTYLGAANWLKIALPGIGSYPLYAFDPAGLRLLERPAFAAQGTADVALHESFHADNFGSVAVGPTPLSLYAELIRVFPGDGAGSIGHINPLRSPLRYDQASARLTGVAADPRQLLGRFTEQSTQGSYCRVEISECPNAPEAVGSGFVMYGAAVTSRSSCASIGPEIQRWCGSARSVVSNYFTRSFAAKQAVTQITGCRVTLEECPNEPGLLGTFEPFEGGAALGQSVCAAQASFYRDYCGSHRPVSAAYLQNGISIASWSADGLPPLPQFAGELGVEGRAPILHAPTYRHERDLFGYHPTVDPNHMGFSPQNEPLVLTPDGEIKKLLRTGIWRTIDLKAQVHSSLNAQGLAWDGRFVADSFNDNRIVFDRDGDGYVLFNTSSGTLTEQATGRTFKTGLLLHSRDGGERWRAYVLPTFREKHAAFIEFQDGNNELFGPPPILLNGGRAYLVDSKTNRLKCATPPCDKPNPAYTSLRMLTPSKQSDGSLVIGAEIPIAESTIFANLHSGGGNLLVSVGDRIHIVYPSFNTVPAVQGTAEPCLTGTPQYVVTYDRSLPAAQRLGTPTFLGCGGARDRHPTNSPPPDSHNIPAITVDSSGYLHVVLGSHHDQFLYRRSRLPNDATGWSNGTRIGEEKRDPGRGWQPNPLAPAGSYTYVALLCDKSDTLHLVARWTGLSYRSRLVYLRKSAIYNPSTAWDDFSDSYSQSVYPPLTGGVLAADHRYQHQHLVVPFQNGYTVYHHKLDVDRLGRLFLHYRTWEQQLSAAVAAEYCARWPEECPNGVLPPNPGQTNCDTRTCWYQNASKPKDPALLMSVDGGNSWKLASSQDLLGGIGP